MQQTIPLYLRRQVYPMKQFNGYFSLEQNRMYSQKHCAGCSPSQFRDQTVIADELAILNPHRPPPEQQRRTVCVLLQTLTLLARVCWTLSVYPISCIYE